jgi:hypothetical protein
VDGFEEVIWFHPKNLLHKKNVKSLNLIFSLSVKKLRNGNSDRVSERFFHGWNKSKKTSEIEAPLLKVALKFINSEKATKFCKIFT